MKKKWKIKRIACLLRRMSQETLKYGSKGRILLTYSDREGQAIQQGDSEIAESWFDQAAEYWKQAIALTPRELY